MTKPEPASKPKSASGSKRQPRLQDVQRLESEVADLKAEVAAATALMQEVKNGLSQNPFSGMTFEDVFVGMMYAMVASSPNVNLKPKAIFQRGQTLLESFRVWRGEVPPPWEERARLKRQEREDYIAAEKKRELRIKEKREGIETPAAGPNIQILDGSAPSLIPSE